MGRPPEHDRDQVLSIATDLFWENGYRGVSIADVVKATGLQPGSLYASFGNKEGLFIACLLHYGQAASCHLPDAGSRASPLDQVESMLNSVVDASIEDPNRRGCFVINALLEIAPQVPSVQKVVRELLDRNEAWIQDRLDEAKTLGEIEGRLDTAEMAACLMGVICTSRVMARAGNEADRIQNVARKTLRSLIDPWRMKSAV